MSVWYLYNYVTMHIELTAGMRENRVKSKELTDRNVTDSRGITLITYIFTNNATCFGRHSINTLTDRRIRNPENGFCRHAK